MTIEAVCWDFGGVISSSPFDAFARYEQDQGLPPGFIRSINATDPDTNAWSLLERNAVDFDRFCTLFEAEARAAGGEVDARVVMELLAGEIRPKMVEALRRCSARLKTALLTNNFLRTEPTAATHEPFLELFDVVVESRSAGVRKPDPAFYRLALEQLGVPAERTVFLDDLGINLKPARQLGMTTIKVVDPDVALDQLEALVGFPLRG
jgi:putative hydrolase of the HAD superfamily